MDIYKQANRIKLRFNTVKGVLSLEQLWDLNLSQLTSLIKELHKILKDGNVDSELAFLGNVSTKDVENQLRFEVVKDIFSIKKQEMDDQRVAKENKDHNEKIMELISQKQDEGLKSKSLEDLQAMLKK